MSMPVSAPGRTKIPPKHISVYIQVSINKITKLSSWGYIIKSQSIELGRRVERLDTIKLTPVELCMIAMTHSLQLISKESPVIVFTKSLKIKEYVHQKRMGNPYYFLQKDVSHPDLLEVFDKLICSFNNLDVRMIKGKSECASAVYAMVESVIRSRVPELTIHFPTEAEYKEWFKEHSDYIIESMDITPNGVRVSYHTPSIAVIEEKQLEQKGYKQESFFDTEPKPNPNERCYIIEALDRLSGKKIGYFGNTGLVYDCSKARKFTRKAAQSKVYFLNKQSRFTWRETKYGTKL